MWRSMRCCSTVMREAVCLCRDAGGARAKQNREVHAPLGAGAIEAGNGVDQVECGEPAAAALAGGRMREAGFCGWVGKVCFYSLSVNFGRVHLVEV